ncbi:MAG: sugar-binding protein [Armatimonadota bacterium]
MSSSEFEFPPAALFSTIAVCPWREQSPRVDGSPADWSEEQLMPPLGQLSGGEQFAALSLAWNDRGLYLAVEVPKPHGAQVVTNRENPGSGDAIELLIDTRGSRTGHRANQFCYHLVILPTPPAEQGGKPVIWQRPIRRALRRSPQIDLDAVRIASGFRDDGYCVEAAFEPDALHGYEPTPGLRIGMAAVIHDIHHGTQFWGASPDVPWKRDPSTWGIVEHARPVTD